MNFEKLAVVYICRKTEEVLDFSLLIVLRGLYFAKFGWERASNMKRDMKPARRQPS